MFKTYVGSALVLAESMEEADWLRGKGHEMALHLAHSSRNRQGYHVCYPDGFECWFPKFTFELTHRNIEATGEAAIFSARRQSNLLKLKPRCAT